MWKIFLTSRQQREKQDNFLQVMTFVLRMKQKQYKMKVISSVDRQKSEV